MRILYFETSAINYLSENVTDEGIRFLRNMFLSLKGNVILALSPVSMWEVLSTPDQEIRDKLIRVCQLLFDDVKLFPSPVKIIDTFMERGCKKEFSIDGFFDTNCWISSVWRDIASNEDKTIIMDQGFPAEDKRRMNQVSKTLRQLIKNEFTPKDIPSDEYYNPACEFINSIFSQVPFIESDMQDGILDKEHICLYKTSIFFALCILVLGIHSDYEERVHFWEKRNISPDIHEQICYLFHHNDTILHRGPLVYMACTAISEVKKGTNRGLYKDCLHAVYMPYCTSFFTRDKHFIAMECDITSELWNRVIDIQYFCESILDHIESE